MRILKHFWLALILISCIEKIDIKNTDGNFQTLVVDGNLSNLSGPYTVRLSYATRKLSNEVDFQRPLPTRNASVFIVNSTDGLEEPLTEIQPGVYKTSEASLFRGQAGKKYHVRIESSGKTYVSDGGMIEIPTSIEFLSVAFKSATKRLEVYVNLKDPEETNDLYRWTWNAYREVHTLLPPIEGTPGNPGNTDTVECCATCYIHFESKDINIFNDRLINGQDIRNQLLASLNIRKPVQYLFEVQQQKLSPEAYEFLRLLTLQKDSEGGLFDPPPYKVRGNIRNIDSDEEVLGFFNVFGAKEDFIMIQGSLYSSTRDRFEGTQNDCRLTVNADTLRPANWIPQ